jgi:putative ABC transport system ATP-binding protein
VQAINLSKTYLNGSLVAVPAVRAVSLEVMQGELLLIGGPNGSGKTTLLSMLGCLIRPSSGHIYIMGREVTGVDQNDLVAFRLRHIGFIFQTFRLLDSLTVLENVELVLNLAGVRQPSSKRRARLMLEELNIAHRASLFPKALSGGEKQRVAIARALANDPALLLADEPTGSLDSSAGQAVIELLSQIVECRNKTVIIVSHDSRIHRYAHRVLQMEDGRITEKLGEVLSHV